ncbi:MAG TPA: TonB-dependent receptor [Pyrinomonadaceae bacterium]|nr:TonB-dependent receptor [Pyrinomonadaceae bacterium]
MIINKVYRGIGSLAILITLAAFSFSQTNRASLHLTVTDPNGHPVAGANVSLAIARSVFKQSATDANGEVTFADLPSGEYRVSVDSKGFSSLTRAVSVAGALPASATIVISPGGLSETVTVTATRNQISSDETAVPVSVVGREDIEREGVNTFGDIFRTLPGTSTANEGAFQVRPRIRGLDSNRVLILVDGERLNNSRTSTGQSGVESGLVETSQIESVEVVRGSGSVLYGTDALGGTINIITRDTPARRDDGFRFGAALDTFYSSNENGRRGNLSLNGSNNFFAFRLAQSLERFDNYSTGKPDANFLSDLRTLGVGITDDGEVLNSQSHGSNSEAAVRFFLNDTNTLRFGYDRRRAANIGSAGLVGTFNGFFPFSDRDKLSGRYDSAALNKYLQRLSVSAFYQTQFRSFTNILTVEPVPPFFPGLYQFSDTVTDTKTTGFDLQTDWSLGGRNYLTAGVSYFRDGNTDRRTIITASTPTSPDMSTSNTKSVPDATLSNIAGFAQDEFRITKRLKFTGGIRIDNFKTAAQPTTGFSLPLLRQDQVDDLGIGSLASGLNVSNTAVTGDAGVVFRASRNVVLSARIGRSFRTPNIFELFFTDAGSIGGFVVGNPNLKPETGTNIDTSVKFKTSRFSASVTYFNNSYRNLLATVPTDDHRGCPIFIAAPGTVYDANNCFVISSPPGQSPVRVYQTQNVDRARIQGLEAEFEAPIKIRLGYLTPNGNFSYLRGDDSERGLPLDFISPFRTNIGIRWNNYGKSYFFDYNARFVGTQNRLSPSYLAPVNQGGNGGPEKGFVTHNMSGGYYFRRERFNFNINLGVSNIFNRAYSEQFVYAPARGRSFTIGTTWEIK